MKVVSFNARSLRNKITDIMSFLDKNKVELAFIQETWLRKSDGHLTSQIREYGYDIISYRKSRKLDFGGGVALLYRNTLKVQSIKKSTYKSFEHIACKVVTENGALNFFNVYRPEYSSKNRFTVNAFLSEFSRLLTDISCEASPCFLVGDYNMHVELTEVMLDSSALSSHVIKQSDAIKFVKLLDEFNLSQVIRQPTHELLGTLDLLICQSGFSNLIESTEICDKDEVCSSDHFCLMFNLNATPIKQAKYIHLIKRDFSSFDIQKFKRKVMLSDLFENPNHVTNIDKATELYQSTLKNALDEQCEINEITVRNRPNQKWFNEDLRNLKREKRSVERTWKKRKNAYWQDKLTKIKQDYKNAIFHTRTKFYSNMYDNDKSDLKKTYKTTKYLTGDQSANILPATTNKFDLANKMADFFKNKVVEIRKEIIQSKDSQANVSSDETSVIKTGCTLSKFKMVTPESTSDVVKGLNSKIHPYDPVPVWLLKDCLDITLPIITNIINISFNDCTFPASLKHAIVRPSIKEIENDHEDFKNYRPVSNLTFLSKILEKSACLQLQEYLNEHSLYPEYQSAYRKGHSCETALLKVVNDIQKDVANRKMVALVMLDLSSAFDTIDIDLLLNKLENCFGITGNVLKWLKSYLTNRTFSVRIENIDGNPVIVVYGVPQGSILGPLLFILYIHDLIDIARKHQLSAHLYADDSQLYLGFSPVSETTCAMTQVKSCLADVQYWMNDNFLKLNLDKTKVIFFGRKNDFSLFSIDLSLGPKIFFADDNITVKTLGVHLDSKLSLQAQVANVVKSCYFNLKKLQQIRHCLCTDTRLLLIKSFVISKLDYCNILLINSSQTLIGKLQRVINASVRFVYNIRPSQSVTEYTKRCHILPAKYRIYFKSCTMVFKIMHGLSPDYLEDIVNLAVENRPNLRSGDDFLQLQESNCSKCIEYGMIKNWNSLPFTIRNNFELDDFRRDLKTYYFEMAYEHR